MFKLILYGLALFGLYTLFFRDKRIVIEDKNTGKKKYKYTDYDEL